MIFGRMAGMMGRGKDLNNSDEMNANSGTTDPVSSCHHFGDETQSFLRPHIAVNPFCEIMKAKSPKAATRVIIIINHHHHHQTINFPST